MNEIKMLVDKLQTFDSNKEPEENKDYLVYNDGRWLQAFYKTSNCGRWHDVAPYHRLLENVTVWIELQDYN